MRTFLTFKFIISIKYAIKLVEHDVAQTVTLLMKFLLLIKVNVLINHKAEILSMGRIFFFLIFIALLVMLTLCA